MTYCPECGAKQSKEPLRNRRALCPSWRYDFVCENCDKIIVVEDWGYNNSEAKE